MLAVKNGHQATLLRLAFCWLYVRDQEILLGIFLLMMNLGDDKIDVSNNVETTANKNLEYST